MWRKMVLFNVMFLVLSFLCMHIHISKYLILVLYNNMELKMLKLSYNI